MNPVSFLILLLSLYMGAGVIGLWFKRISYGIVAFTALLTLVLMWYNAIELTLVSNYFMLIASLIWLFVALYSLGYEPGDGVLASSFAFTTAMMFVILISKDAITFLAGWEGMTVASFLSLYSHKDSRRSAYMFLAFGELSTAFILSGFAYAYYLSGSLFFSAWHGLSAWSVIYMLLAFGFITKMAVFPFHIWLPEAHSKAPANMSAQLSAVMTLMGVYGLISFLNVGTPNMWVGGTLLVLGGITALWGAFYAAVADHVKKLPAYSTVENDGVIIALSGAFILTMNIGNSVVGGFILVSLLFFAFVHSTSKSLLFIVAGKLERSGGEFLGGNFTMTRLGVLGGYLAAISLSGIPPLPGYIGEWMAIESMFQSFYLSNLTLKLITVIVGALIALTAGISTIAMSKFIVHGVDKSKIKKADSSDSGIIIGAGLILIIGAVPQLLFWLFAPIIYSMTGIHASKFLGGLLGIPQGTLIISGAGFGVLSPTMLFTWIALIFLSLYLIFRFKFIRHARTVDSWSGGLKNAEYPVRAHSTILLSTQKWLYGYTKGFNYRDAVSNGFVSFGRGAFTASRVFQTWLMPGNDRRYVLYLIITLFSLLIYVALIA